MNGLARRRGGPTFQRKSPVCTAKIAVANREDVPHCLGSFGPVGKRQILDLVVRTFPGTLGGGDVVVCRPVRGVRP